MESSATSPKKRKPGRPKKDGSKTSIYVTKEANRLWEATAERMGVDKTAVLEMALREKAKNEGVS